MKKWIFDEAPPNQYNPGESVLDQIFASSSSLAKEPLQNAIDRITEANKQNQAQGKIEISLMEFSGAKKSELLESINWSSLRDHVAAVSEDGSRKFSTRLKNAISRIEEKIHYLPSSFQILGPLAFLVVILNLKTISTS